MFKLILPFLSLVILTVGGGIYQEYCEVVIAGGSTAAFAAAISSAQNKVHTCLLEPTDWPGYLIFNQ
jgi:hypothetical protein